MEIMMSIEKFIVTKESLPFTTLSNYVLQNLQDPRALGVWCYLSSLPPDWIIYKKQIQEHFKLGREQLDKVLRYLKNVKLLTIDRVRNEKGQFTHSEMCILNGTAFAQLQIDIKNKELIENAHPHAEKPLTGNRALVNSTYKYNKEKENKEKRYCASDDARPKDRCEAEEKPESLDHMEMFDEFMKIYPNKKNKKIAKKQWQKINPSLVPKILAKVREQVANEIQWQDKRFVPLASTYLNAERWEDEITTHADIVRAPNIQSFVPKNEIRSTIKEWKAGNPDYDRYHGLPMGRPQ
jgi:hypothetical protein